MKRKANQAKLEKNNQETMPKKDLEQYFTAIQQRFDEQDVLIQQRFDEQNKFIQQRFNEQDKKMRNILDIVKTYDQERREVKSTLWEHDRRLLKLERDTV